MPTADGVKCFLGEPVLVVPSEKEMKPLVAIGLFSAFDGILLPSTTRIHRLVLRI